MKPPMCPDCQYDLRGLGASTRHCPECGTRVDIDPVSIDARPCRTLHQHPIALIGIALAGLSLIVTLPNVGLYLEIAPELLMLMFVAIGIVLLAWCVPIVAEHGSPQRTDWPCRVVFAEDGVHVDGVDLKQRPLHYLIDWPRMRSVNAMCDRRQRALLRLSARGTVSPNTDPEASDPEAGLLPTILRLDCTYEHAQVIARDVNWHIAAWRTANRGTRRVC